MANRFSKVGIELSLQVEVINHLACFLNPDTGCIKNNSVILL